MTEKRCYNMERIVKTVPCSHGILDALVNTSRYVLVECDAALEITEEIEHIPVLGKGRVVRGRYITLLITAHHKPNSAIDPHSIDSIGFKGEYLRSDGKNEVVEFSRCLLVSDLDLTAAGECRFEVQCSDALLDRLHVA